MAGTAFATGNHRTSTQQQLYLLDQIRQLLGGGAPPAPEETPGYIVADNASGSVATGAVAVTIANVGLVAGTVDGKALAPGTAIGWQATHGATLGTAIPYDATGTKFQITTVR